MIRPENRKDTKFIFRRELLPVIADKLRSGYCILENDSRRISRYRNRYYDTEDLRFYLQHHNGRRPRNKVRIRHYQETETAFFEIKTRDNKNRTIKNRVPLEPDAWQARAPLAWGDSGTPLEFRDLILAVTAVAANALKPTVDISFSRVTLAENGFAERVTLDHELCVSVEDNTKCFEELVIAEIKQDKYRPGSEFIQLMRSLSIPETRFSKYCLGINTHYQVKHNRFKPRFSYLNRILKTTKGI